MMEYLIRVEAPHFCAGIVVKDNIVVKAAPILKWTLGKTWEEVSSYFKEKKYIVSPFLASRMENE